MINPGPTALDPAGVDHLAQLLAVIRPDWDTGLVRVVLHSHTHQVRAADLIEASIRAARVERFTSPRFIGWRGQHWDGLATRPVEAAATAWCAICGKVEHRCLSERYGDDDHEFEATRKSVRTRWSR